MVRSWDEPPQTHLDDPFSITTNKKPVTLGRKTSYAFGGVGSPIKMRAFEINTTRRAALNRENARKVISEKLLEGGKVQDIIDSIDEDGNGEISFQEFRNWLDKQGLSMMHQDSNDLMRQIDTNGDGILQLEELEDFLKADQGAIKAKADDIRGAAACLAHKAWPLMPTIDYDKKPAVPQEQDPFAVRTNNTPFQSGRRTTYVFGEGMRNEAYNRMVIARKEKVREQLIRHFVKRVEETGGVDGMLEEMGGGEEVTWPEFKAWLDKQGMGLVHQDGMEMMTLIDANGDGILQREELESFLRDDPAVLKKEREKEQQRNAPRRPKGSRKSSTKAAVPYRPHIQVDIDPLSRLRPLRQKKLSEGPPLRLSRKPNHSRHCSKKKMFQHRVVTHNLGFKHRKKEMQKLALGEWFKAAPKVLTNNFLLSTVST